MPCEAVPAKSSAANRSDKCGRCSIASRSSDTATSARRSRSNSFETLVKGLTIKKIAAMGIKSIIYLIGVNFSIVRLWSQFGAVSPKALRVFAETNKKTARRRSGDGLFRACQTMRDSSMLRPVASILLIQRGVLPRPAQVCEGSSGFRYFGRTSG